MVLTFFRSKKETGERDDKERDDKEREDKEREDKEREDKERENEGEPRQSKKSYSQTSSVRFMNISKELWPKYFENMLWISSLILPSTTVKIFTTFLCFDMDPLGESKLKNTWVLSSENIDCKSDEYNDAWRLAVAMVFFYPILLPLIYFLLLYTFKEEIMCRKGSNICIIHFSSEKYLRAISFCSYFLCRFFSYCVFLLCCL